MKDVLNESFLVVAIDSADCPSNKLHSVGSGVGPPDGGP